MGFTFLSLSLFLSLFFSLWTDTPEDPLSALELWQASFSWQASDPDSAGHPLEEQTGPSVSLTGSLLLSSLNLSVQQVCMQLIKGYIKMTWFMFAVVLHRNDK